MGRGKNQPKKSVALIRKGSGKVMSMSRQYQPVRVTLTNVNPDVNPNVNGKNIISNDVEK